MDQDIEHMKDQNDRLIEAATTAYDVLSVVIGQVDADTAKEVKQAMLTIGVALRRE